MSNFPERLEALQPFFNSWYLDANLGESSYGKVYRIHLKEFDQDYYAALKWISLPQTQSEVAAFRNDGIDDAAIRAHSLFQTQNCPLGYQAGKHLPQ